MIETVIVGFHGLAFGHIIITNSESLLTNSEMNRGVKIQIIIFESELKVN